MTTSSRRWALLGAVGVLAASWLGPLPKLAHDSFTAHMALHMAVVAIAAPLYALAVAGSRFDPARARWLAPIPASLVELLAVWAWHAPALHHAARGGGAAFALEQATFFAAGVALWSASVGGDEAARSSRRAAGIVALLLTSMHMTLLGALLALAPRALYMHAVAVTAGSAAAATAALDDQQLGGILMLLVGGASYLIGGLWLTAGIVRGAPLGVAPPPRSRTALRRRIAGIGAPGSRRAS